METATEQEWDEIDRLEKLAGGCFSVPKEKLAEFKKMSEQNNKSEKSTKK